MDHVEPWETGRARRAPAPLLPFSQAVQKYGGARAGCRTMLDALLPAEAAMQQALARGAATAAEVAAAGAAAAAQGAEATKGMAALAGRSSYVPEEILRASADPGARAVALWLGAVAAALAA
jgi:dihydroxyacetone kinase